MHHTKKFRNCGFDTGDLEVGARGDKFNTCDFNDALNYVKGTNSLSLSKKKKTCEMPMFNSTLNLSCSVRLP